MSGRKADEATVIDPRTGLPVYGLDQELLLKQQAKYDPEKEALVRNWIEDCVGEQFSSPDFQESLKDGVLLCKLANALSPGAVPKINNSKLAFMQMENIDKFLKAVEKWGVKKSDQFRSVDLFEAKNMVAVVDTLFIVASVAQLLPNYNGPKVGIKIAEKKSYNFSEEQMLKARAAPSALSEGGLKNEVKKSIGREVVKTSDSGDKRFTSAYSVASEKQDSKKSIKYDVVKSANAGDRSAMSMQFQPSEKQHTQQSISNNIVKVQPQQAAVSKPAPAPVAVVAEPEPEPEPQPEPEPEPVYDDQQPADGEAQQFIEVPADVAEELEQLAELVQSGIITEEEYEQKRMEILAQFMPQ